MKQQERLRQGWWHRWWRRLGLDCNPMRRRIDRIQAVIQTVLLLGFLAGAPAVAAYTGYRIYVSGMRTGRVQVAAWHRVPAVVLKVGPIAGWSRSASPVSMLVRWLGPDRAWRTGEIEEAKTAVTGGTVTVWVDAKGKLTHPPLTSTEVIAQTARTAAAVTVGLGLLLMAVGWAVSFLLDRQRLADWEADWSVTEPRWTRSTPPDDGHAPGR
ncbi:MAG TPA: hypothetical protein VH637_07700 [Streptosporangiaceae bacterium]